MKSKDTWLKEKITFCRSKLMKQEFGSLRLMIRHGRMSF